MKRPCGCTAPTLKHQTGPQPAAAARCSTVTALGSQAMSCTALPSTTASNPVTSASGSAGRQTTSQPAVRRPSAIRSAMPAVEPAAVA